MNKKLLSFIISLFIPLSAISATDSYNSKYEVCKDGSYVLPNINFGEEINFSWLGNSITIYKRTESEITDLLEAQVSGVEQVPTWWKGMPYKPYTVEDRQLRSQNKMYFVFWTPSPIFGCHLVHVQKDEAQKGGVYSFLNEDWPGGYFEPCYGIGYNYSGHPIFAATGLPENILKLSKNRLVIPNYSISDNNLNLICD